MLASDVVSLVESDGLNSLTTIYGISRLAAERTYVAAKRTLNNGYNIQVIPGADIGTVRPSLKPTEAPEEPQEPTLEDEAWALARRIKHESAGVAGASIADLRSKLAVCERNLGKGYPEWTH